MWSRLRCVQRCTTETWEECVFLWVRNPPPRSIAQSLVSWNMLGLGFGMKSRTSILDARMFGLDSVVCCWPDAHTRTFSRWACNISPIRTLLHGSRSFRVKRVRVIIFAHFHLILRCRCWTFLKVLSHKSYPHRPAQDPDLQRQQHPFRETLASPLAGAGCLDG